MKFKNIMPLMDSNTHTDVILSCDNTLDGYFPYRMFNNIIETVRCEFCNNGGGSTIINFAFQKQDFIIRQYCILPYNKWKPKTWTFEGSHNNKEWKILDNQKNFNMKNLEWNNFLLDNETKYSYYRLNVTESDNNDYVVIQEMKLCIQENFSPSKYLLEKDGKFYSIKEHFYNFNNKKYEPVIKEIKNTFALNELFKEIKNEKENFIPFNKIKEFKRFKIISFKKKG